MTTTKKATTTTTVIIPQRFIEKPRHCWSCSMAITTTAKGIKAHYAGCSGKAVA